MGQELLFIDGATKGIWTVLFSHATQGYGDEYCIRFEMIRESQVFLRLKIARESEATDGRAFALPICKAVPNHQLHPVVPSANPHRIQFQKPCAVIVASRPVELRVRFSSGSLGELRDWSGEHAHRSFGEHLLLKSCFAE